MLSLLLFEEIDEMNERRRTRGRDIRESHIEIGGELLDPSEGTFVLLNIGRAILARTLFIVHSIATIWQTVHMEERNSVWGFALIAIAILLEGAHTIVMRAGDERKWFCPSVLLYVIATAPPIWLLERKLCEWRMTKQGLLADEEFRLQMLEQLLLVVLIIGRWLLPKGDISREQLSQILLAYLAISSDIVEFFDVFKEKVVWSSPFVQHIILGAWTLSLLQFPFVLTVSRARKMRVAITKNFEELIVENRRPDPCNLSLLQFPFVLTVSRARKMRVAITKNFEELIVENRRPDPCNVLYDVDMWAIILANSLQDIPFLSVRLYLMFDRGLVTYTMVFFTCKNALIIVLQTYRAFILFNDRYLHPRLTSIEAPVKRARRVPRRHANGESRDEYQPICRSK
ncbi:Transmembrane protein 26 [Toxocara canis]|uniref:Transmembrane protein 26 n=1 Tax=Toxocara canis TaxID=6265 RepID=A0A0B2V7L9_TOXCA|nr:Transmembrane protein 26 [Toxocara canis]